MHPMDHFRFSWFWRNEKYVVYNKGTYVYVKHTINMLKYVLGFQRDKLIKVQQYQHCSRAMTSWGIYTQQPYDPFRKRVCVNAGTCSHVVYLPHGYWKMVVLSNVCGKKFLGTERGHYKLFWRMVTGPTFFSFPILSWYRFPKACSGIFIFLLLFLLFIRCSCCIYIFVAVVLTICKKKHQPNWINLSYAIFVVSSIAGL